MVKEVDEKRASFHKFCTGKAWEDASQYQLSIDTGKVSISDAVELIVIIFMQSLYEIIKETCI